MPITNHYYRHPSILSQLPEQEKKKVKVLVVQSFYFRFKFKVEFRLQTSLFEQWVSHFSEYNLLPQLPIESNQVSVHFFGTVFMVNGNRGFDCSVVAVEMKLYKFPFQLKRSDDQVQWRVPRRFTIRLIFLWWSRTEAVISGKRMTIIILAT